MGCLDRPTGLGKDHSPVADDSDRRLGSINDSWFPGPVTGGASRSDKKRAHRHVRSSPGRPQEVVARQADVRVRRGSSGSDRLASGVAGRAQDGRCRPWLPCVMWAGSGSLVARGTGRGTGSGGSVCIQGFPGAGARPCLGVDQPARRKLASATPPPPSRPVCGHAGHRRCCSPLGRRWPAALWLPGGGCAGRGLWADGGP